MSSQESKPVILIIGYGNPLRGDDGVGWHAAQRLEHSLGGEGVEVVTAHQLTPELAFDASTASAVVFIDASVAVEPGCVSRVVITPMEDVAVASTHDLEPEALLGLAKMLYDACPESVMFAVGADSFEVTEQLSPKASAALEEVVRQVEDFVRSRAGRS